MENLEKFDDMPIRKFISNRKLKIQFETDSVRQKFEKLLEHRCNLCPNRPPERSFKALRDHMRRQHTLFFCDLCVELKVKTFLLLSTVPGHFGQGSFRPWVVSAWVVPVLGCFGQFWWVVSA